MTDTQILNWIQDHLVTMSQNLNKDFEMQWLNERGDVVKTVGTSLRDCVERACCLQFVEV